MSASSVPLVTSSIDDEAYDFDADLAATIDAQDALRALEPEGEDQGGQEDWGIYQDDDEYDNHDGQQDFVRHGGALISTTGYDQVSFDGATPNIEPPAPMTNGVDDDDSAEVAFARASAAAVSSMGYDQPSPTEVSHGTSHVKVPVFEQPTADMTDASKRGRGSPHDTSSAGSEPRLAAKRGTTPPPQPTGPEQLAARLAALSADPLPSFAGVYPYPQVQPSASASSPSAWPSAVRTPSHSVQQPAVQQPPASAPAQFSPQPTASQPSAEHLNLIREGALEHAALTREIAQLRKLNVQFETHYRTLECRSAGHQQEAFDYSHRYNEAVSELRNSRSNLVIAESGAQRAIGKLETEQQVLKASHNAA